MDLTKKIEDIRFIGPAYAKRLKNLDISTVRDLLYHIPHRYDDFSQVKQISEIHPGDVVSVRGKVWQIKNVFSRTHKMMTVALINDGTGTLRSLWFHQPYLKNTLKEGTEVTLAGQIEWFQNKPALMSPEFEIGKAVHTARIVPTYPVTAGISSKWLRSRMKPLLDEAKNSVVDFLPEEIQKRCQLLPLGQALQEIHFPTRLDMVEKARKRLAFDELFLLQLIVGENKRTWKKKQPIHPIKVPNGALDTFLSHLPFTATTAQIRCMKELQKDLSSGYPMNRLLQGDVGSGKTVVAAFAMYLAHLNGFLSTLMAPTDILAKQHYQTLTDLFGPLGISVDLVTASQKTKTSGFESVVVGTHALIYKKIHLENVTVTIVDEQHRFGVEQRTLLKRKGKAPHILTMTATPIPRTVALTLYGDLDLSTVDEMPKGRKIIQTWVVPPQKRQAAYQWIKEQKTQAFIICPLIEESETLTTVRAATKEFEKLQKDVFPNLSLGLLHGRMKAKEKDHILQLFREQNLDILVSTPVVEVGIDIPHATIMVIEAAERFGLAGLHQLRGRVGRSDRQSYCLLFTDSPDPHVTEKLKHLEHTHNGMQLSELDLKLRGPGEIFGTKQHGYQELRIADYSDLTLIEQTKKEAETLLETTGLSSYPLLIQEIQQTSSLSVEPN
ncbi:MAG TPA: ATP-dependent DNA helicase RecG [Patescibacteria group bacterium]|nr:ATP-dependent DNA helicase RecG [Patescibacteria group bacterium]